MTTPFLADDISSDEGFRMHAYPDPLSGGEPWTCGYGCTGANVGPHTVWAESYAAQMRDAKIAEAIETLSANLTFWPELNDARQDVLVNMFYNMGWHRERGFHHMIAELETLDYEGAAREMLDSAWAHQVGHRATRLAEQMRTGERA